MTSKSLISAETKLKVSSVLNRDITNYGKQHLTDESLETCWNSEQGLPQNVLLDFGHQVEIETILMTFQGGFVGKKCVVVASPAESPNNYSMELGTLYPEDVNQPQSFNVLCPQPVQRLKLIFEESTDFFGRITMYKLDIMGRD
ncbi:galactose-binding domain-like protein [Umbelopsis sp. PMI_123]|nr:galactose-binding domain-like protein [Umbelopsis sp. PMI_123]